MSEVSLNWRNDRVLWFIMGAALLLGLIYNSVILIGFGPDEMRHMNYVKLLYEEQALPYVLPGTVPDAVGNEAEYKGAHSYHPPLYYLVLLPFYAIFQNLPDGILWHLMRCLSLIMCLAALPFIYQIAQRATAGSSHASRLIVAQVALLPMWMMTASTINNDAAVFLLVTIFLWLLAVRFPQDRSLKSAAIIGVVFGLCAVSKANAIPANAIALILFLLAQYRGELLRSAQVWKQLGVVLGILAIIASPWQLYNLSQYGSLMHTPPPMPSTALPSPSNGFLVMMLHDNFPQHLLLSTWGISSTLWSQKDWIPEGIRTLVYVGLFGYCAIAFLGLAVGRKSTPSTDEKPDNLAQKIALSSTVGAFLVSWMVVFFISLFVHWGWAEGGRYLFPTVIGLSILLACGWKKLLGESGLKSILILWITGMLFLNVIAIYWLIVYLNPTYGPGS